MKLHGICVSAYCSVGDLTNCSNCDTEAMGTKTEEEICNLKFVNDTLTFKSSNQSPCKCPEMMAGRYLHELETLLDVPRISSQLREKIFNEEIVDTFHKLSLMQNLTNETTKLIANVGTLLISKLAEHPGPGGKPTEGGGFPKSIYYVLKMFSRVPHVSMEVITNLKEFGMKLIY